MAADDTVVVILELAVDARKQIKQIKMSFFIINMIYSLKDICAYMSRCMIVPPMPIVPAKPQSDQSL